MATVWQEYNMTLCLGNVHLKKYAHGSIGYYYVVTM